MSTKLTDVPNQAVLGASFVPAVRTTSAEGEPVDLTSGDGPCFAILTAGTVASGTSVACVLEESSDEETWDAIENAEFPTVSSSNQNLMIQFPRTRRYIRATATITGMSASAAFAVLIGQQKKGW